MLTLAHILKESCDYPNIAKEVCERVISGKANRGILVCGTGIGMSIAANKVHGIRAALCGDTYSARVSRLITTQMFYVSVNVLSGRTLRLILLTSG